MIYLGRRSWRLIRYLRHPLDLCLSYLLDVGMSFVFSQNAAWTLLSWFDRKQQMNCLSRSCLSCSGFCLPGRTCTKVDCLGDLKRCCAGSGHLKSRECCGCFLCFSVTQRHCRSGIGLESPLIPSTDFFEVIYHCLLSWIPRRLLTHLFLPESPGLRDRSWYSLCFYASFYLCLFVL